MGSGGVGTQRRIVVGGSEFDGDERMCHAI
jgi:hypothetical protein